jgi:maleamate amidohydrolase
MTDDYQRRSYGEISVGTGEKPGIVVVDFQLGFTDPQYPLGGAPLVMRAVENTAKLLKVARRVGVPVAVCNTAIRPNVFALKPRFLAPNWHPKLC